MTTGAGNDIERATEMARKMVCEWGMSELGPLSFGKKEEQIFLGREIASTATTPKRRPFASMRKSSALFHRLQPGARHHRAAFERARPRGGNLLEREVLDGAEVKNIMGGGTLPPWPATSRRTRPTTPSR